MTDDELAAIRARCEAATPGPWEWERSYSVAYPGTDGKCCYCLSPKANELVREFVAEDGRPAHVHRFAWDDYPDKWHFIDSADGTTITGNYDYEDGGVASKREDADFIAHARTDVPALLAEVERLRKELEWATDECYRLRERLGVPD